MDRVTLEDIRALLTYYETGYPYGADLFVHQLVRHTRNLLDEYERACGVVARLSAELEANEHTEDARLAITENALKVHQFELERMSARIARIRELHQPDVVNDGPHTLVLCRECMHPMDCPTIQALDGDPE